MESGLDDVVEFNQDVSVGREREAMRCGAMRYPSRCRRVSKNGSDGIEMELSPVAGGVHKWERGGNVVAGFGNDMGGSNVGREELGSARAQVVGLPTSGCRVSS